MLDLLIDAAHQLEQDAEATQDVLRARDQRVGESLRRQRGRRAEPGVQLAEWIKAVRGDAPMSQRVMAGLWSVSMGLAGLGFLFGAAVVSVVFFYDGSQPVNITRALWVLVALPLALTGLAMTLIALTASSRARRLPPVRALSAVLSSIQIGVLWRWVRIALPLEQRAVLDDALGRGAAQGRLHGAVTRWQVLRWSQVFVVCYQLGVVGGFTALITMEDRAFAWSTTLSSVDDAADRYQSFVRTVALPWLFLGSPWVPDAELVQATGYDRYGASPASAFDAGQSKQWWRFLLLSVVVYGLLPRAVFWLVCVLSMRRAAERALTRLPGIDWVLDRLNHLPPEDRQAAAGTAAAETVERSATGESAFLSTPRPLPPQAAESFVCLNWAEAPYRPAAETFPVGGTRTVAEDERALDDAASLVKRGVARGVHLAVRGWEPPTVELADLIKDLRMRLGDGPAIRVHLAGETVKPAVWRSWLSGLKDPWTLLAEEHGHG